MFNELLGLTKPLKIPKNLIHVDYQFNQRLSSCLKNERRGVSNSSMEMPWGKKEAKSKYAIRVVK